jgi:hypothetical protein
MGALPDLAPVGQNHLLRSSSVVQKVTYSPSRISYKTFDPVGSQVLRLGFKPVRITAGDSVMAERKNLYEAGYTIEPAGADDYIVRITQKTSNQIVIEGK